MEDLYKMIYYAVSLEFNGPRTPKEAATMAIAFANTDYCKQAYFLFKNNFKGQKLTLEIEVANVTLNATFFDSESVKLFTATLNYDKTHLNAFVNTWPPGQPIALVFGVLRHCEFYLINPEDKQSDFSIFVLDKYNVANGVH